MTAVILSLNEDFGLDWYAAVASFICSRYHLCVDEVALAHMCTERARRFRCRVEVSEDHTRLIVDTPVRRFRILLERRSLKADERTSSSTEMARLPDRWEGEVELCGVLSRKITQAWPLFGHGGIQ